MVSKGQLKEWANHGRGFVAFWLLVASVFYALFGDVLVAGLMNYPYVVGFVSGAIAVAIVGSAGYFVARSPISQVGTTSAGRSIRTTVVWSGLLILALLLAVMVLLLVVEGLQILLGWAGVDPADQFELSKEIVLVALIFGALPAVLYRSYRQLRSEFED